MRVSMVARQTRFGTLFTTTLVAFWVAILLGVIGSYSFLNWDRWTGFRENGSLWSWLQLLSAPLFISALPFVFGRGRPTPESHQQAALDAFQDYILELILNKDLRGSPSGGSARAAARARTLSTLRRMGNERKRDVLVFLYEADLISRENAIVDLRNADLRNADLSSAKLDRADLNGVDLSGAVLSRADFRDAILINVNLVGADITRADLSGANLEGATYSNDQLAGAHLS